MEGFVEGLTFDPDFEPEFRLSVLKKLELVFLSILLPFDYFFSWF